MNSFYKTEDVVLKVRELCSRLTISGKQFANIKVDAQQDMFSNNLCLQLRAYVLSRTLKEISHKYPASGFDSLKLYFFPLWLKKKFPVKYTEIKIMAFEVYPDISFPEKQPFIMMRKYTNYLEETP